MPPNPRSTNGGESFSARTVKTFALVSKRLSRRLTRNQRNSYAIFALNTNVACEPIPGTDWRTRMCDLTINHETASAYVEQAQAMARKSMDAWCSELGGLGLPAMQENMLGIALQCGDTCLAGELLEMYLGARIAEQAKDKAREELNEKYGKEIAA